MYKELKVFLEKLSPMSNDEWQAFKALVRVKTFDKGSLISRAGEVENHLYFIARGGVRIYYIKEGGEINVGFRLENEFTSSYASFLTRKPSYQYIEAMEHTRCYALCYNDLQHAYSASKNGERLGRLNAEYLFIEKEEHESLLMVDSPDERFRKLSERKKNWLQRIPQKELASYLNLTPETISRIKRRNTPKTGLIS